MAPRPNWKGYLKLSLVSCPIALYPASSASERVSFHRIRTAFIQLLQANSHVSWSPTDCQPYLDTLRKLWNNWPSP
jgi:hypothetical protein